MAATSRYFIHKFKLSSKDLYQIQCIHEATDDLLQNYRKQCILTAGKPKPSRRTSNNHDEDAVAAMHPPGNNILRTGITPFIHVIVHSISYITR